MAKDPGGFKSLHNQLHNNWLLLNCEDWALKPEEISNQIQNFLGLKMPKKLLKWLDENTKAKTMDWTYRTRRNRVQIAQTNEA